VVGEPFHPSFPLSTEIASDAHTGALTTFDQSETLELVSAKNGKHLLANESWQFSSTTNF